MVPRAATGRAELVGLSRRSVALALACAVLLGAAVMQRGFSLQAQERPAAKKRAAPKAPAGKKKPAVKKGAPGPAKPAAGAAKKPPASDAGPEAEEELPLIEQDPFDRLTVRDGKGGEVQLKLFPVELPGRRVPENPDPRSKLRIRLMSHPSQLAEVAWKDVIKLELYEQMVLEEAEKLMREGQMDQAFRYLAFLKRYYPHTPGLAAAEQFFLYLDAGQSFRNQRYPEALAVLEQLYRQNPDYHLSDNSPPLVELISRAADKIIEQYIQREDYRSARELIRRLTSQYGQDHKVETGKWIQRLAEMAREQMEQARQHLQAGRPRAAHRAVHRMLQIWPTIQGGKQLQAEIQQRFPLVNVGVLYPAIVNDPVRIDNWAARRVGRLTQQTLVRLVGQGVEGGQYVFPAGAIELSEDGKLLTFRLNRSGSTSGPADAYRLARWLLELANPDSPLYVPGWARLVGSIEVQDRYTAVVHLQHLHVLPEAFLQVPLGRLQGLAQIEDGRYTVVERSDREVSLAPNPKFGNESSRHWPQIVEQYFPDSQEAVKALERGTIDVLDYVFPADLWRLHRHEEIKVQPYQLPTVHLLVPNMANPHLNNLTFRRALAYGIDREFILNELLLGGRAVPGCRVISGPFPASIPGTAPDEKALPALKNDAIGYAYDERIEVRPFQRRLAATLAILGDRQLEEAAKRAGQQPPERKTLVLAHPGGEVARIACQSIAQQLASCGIDVQLRELPPGATDDPDRNYDLLYVEAAVWEPLVDARRLLGPDGVARSRSPYIHLALRRLDAATNWTEARRRLYELHQTVHDDLSVIPLWQMVNYFAYRNNVRGTGQQPLTLYRNVHQWQILPQ